MKISTHIFCRFGSLSGILTKETGSYFPEQYGRCDREAKRGYFLDPYTGGYAKAIWEIGEFNY